MTQDVSSAGQDLDVAVVIPTLNEAGHIEGLVRHLLKDALFTSQTAEIWVADGGSEDATKDIVGRLTGEGLPVRLLENPLRTQSNAVNQAAEAASDRGAHWMIRIDAHAEYPDGFLSGVLATLQTEGVQSVVVPMRTLGGNAVQDAASDLYNSWLGNGGSAHRSGGYRGLVEHGHHAGFELAAFRAVGGYDTRFIANEDAELDKRLIASGARIFMENRWVVGYIPRKDLEGSFRQMWRNGRFRVWNATKHNERLGLRQLLPVAVSLMVAGSLLGIGWAPLGFPLVMYLLLVGILSVMGASQKTPQRILLVMALALIAHVAFGWGALRGYAELYLISPQTRKALQA